jgi:hypothetical protein
MRKPAHALPAKPARPNSASPTKEAIGRNASGGHELPDYDPAAVGRMAKRVQILSVDLVGAHFDRKDNSPLPVGSATSATPELGIDVEYELSKDTRTLGCVLTFGTMFRGRAPYSLVARFRLTYSVEAGQRPSPHELMQFAYWNAVFNAWPYWREYLSSTINRAHLPLFTVPVMRAPR